MKTLHIDIVSDIACPWCAIGYARLKLAMRELAGELGFNVQWRAFELNPDQDAEPMPILDALSRKYGRSVAEMEATQSNMMSIAQELGLDFTRMQERYTRNTFDAHRLVKWAGEQGKQTEMKMALFDAYFGKAADIADSKILAGCAESIGLSAAQAIEILNSTDFAQAVRDEETTYQQAGVSAVPAFIINQQYMIAGAQEPGTLVEALREIAASAPE
ncbi:DsbA family oxidoreductase [Halopseudomonas pelagia]|uniref:DsbA family oxidoreductase n=1 Tax=Halopseudomonas pelagia TaxID=553151 RepID=UPI0003A1E478|nr:DsbA family oxidoreductase [Halopseudomonas pelagia]